jgi:flagellar motor switch protein FliG
MIAAKVRLDSQPLEDEFKFLMSAEIDEFIGILRDLSEPEAIAAVAYAPRRLRERFFASANPTFTAKFVEQVTKIDKMPDHFVREVARKLRKIYAEKGSDLRTIRVDKIPLLEQALNSLEGKDRIRLLVDIGKDNPNFLQSVAPNVFLDDALPMLADDILTEALLTISPQEAGAYLGGFNWGTGVLKRISPRLQDTIKPYMSNSGGSNQVTISSARKKIAEFVKEQDHMGKIDLRSLNVQLISGQVK